MFGKTTCKIDTFINTKIYLSRMDDSKYLVFYIENNLYGIDSGNVGLLQYFNPNSVTRVPLAKTQIRGIINHNGKITTVLNLREFLGLECLENKLKELSVFFEARKQDHIAYMTKYEYQLLDSTSINLESNPQKCALGVALGQREKSKDFVLESYIKSIDWPHLIIHSSIEQVNGLLRSKKIDKARQVFDDIKRVEYKEMMRILDAIIVRLETNEGYIVPIIYKGEEVFITTDYIYAIKTLGNGFPIIEKTGLIKTVMEDDTGQSIRIIDIEKLWDKR